MALDFPASPSNGATYTGPNGVVWIWDGVKWTVGTQSGAYLPLSGGTLTGPLTVTGLQVNHGGGDPIIVNTPIATDAHIQFHNSTTSDWKVGAQGFANPGEFWIFNNKTSTLPLRITQADVATMISLNITANLDVQGRAALMQIDLGDTQATRMGFLDGVTGHAGFNGDLYLSKPARQWQLVNDNNSFIFKADGVNKFWYDPTSTGTLNVSGNVTASGANHAFGSTAGAMAVSLTAQANTDLSLIFNGLRQWKVNQQGFVNSGEFWIYDATAAALRLQLTAAGTCNASSAWGIVSDAALKTDITPLPRGLADILKLNPSRFTYLQSGLAGTGLIAQELETVMPELVREMPLNDSGEMTKAVVETGIIWPLINAIKELKAEIDALKGTRK